MNRAASLALILVAPFAQACDLNPAAMRRELASKSPKELIAKWWDGGPCETALLDGIASGRREWVELAVQLSAHTDAGSSETLVLSLGEAMLRAPTRVLPLVNSSLLLNTKVCFPWGFDDSEAARARELVRAQQALRMFGEFSGTKYASNARICAGFVHGVLERVGDRPQ